LFELDLLALGLDLGLKLSSLFLLFNLDGLKFSLLSFLFLKQGLFLKHLLFNPHFLLDSLPEHFFLLILLSFRKGPLLHLELSSSLLGYSLFLLKLLFRLLLG